MNIETKQEAIESLVKLGYYRSMLLSCTEKQLQEKANGEGIELK